MTLVDLGPIQNFWPVRCWKVVQCDSKWRNPGRKCYFILFYVITQNWWSTKVKYAKTKGVLAIQPWISFYITFSQKPKISVILLGLTLIDHKSHRQKLVKLRYQSRGTFTNPVKSHNFSLNFVQGIDRVEPHSGKKKSSNDHF